MRMISEVHEELPLPCRIKLRAATTRQTNILLVQKSFGFTLPIFLELLKLWSSILNVLEASQTGSKSLEAQQKCRSIPGGNH